MTHRYHTSVDGMKHIETLNTLSPGDYLYIQDELYADECPLFKIKQLSGSELDLKLVKTVNVYDYDEHFTSPVVTYTFNNTTLSTEKRLSKNQIIYLNGRYYSISDIQKAAEGPNVLHLSFLPYIQADNLYAVYQTHKTSKKRDIVDVYSDYGEALGKVFTLRGKENNFFYHLG